MNHNNSKMEMEDEWMKKIALALAVMMMMSILSACAPSSQENAAPPAPTEAPAPNVPSDIPPEQKEVWDKEVDVLVVGSGGAGLSAAVEAADAGAEKVLIIEKLAAMGGVTFLSQGIMSGFETQITKKLDIHCTADQCYEQQMKETDYAIDPILTRITSDQCGISIDWLIDEIGVPFQEVVDASPVYGPLPLLHHTEGGGQAFKEPFLKALEERNIELLLETKATELIGDEERNVTGAAASTPDGEIRIKAKAVILCTGGYANNTDLIRRIHPKNDLFNGAGAPGSTGDAMLLASEFGACIVNGDNAQCYIRDYDDVNSKIGGWTIYVGANGERFMDETLMVTTFNQAIMQAVNHRMHEDGTDYIWLLNDQAAMDLYKPSRPDGMEYIQADNIEGLAEAMGVEGSALKATVDRWNQMVEQEADDDFGRTSRFVKIETPPFYAVKGKPGAVITYGGVLRNEKSEVVKVNGDIIPGLYVAGEAAAAANANGWTVSHAITWGRIAGQNAGAYAAGK